MSFRVGGSKNGCPSIQFTNKSSLKIKRTMSCHCRRVKIFYLSQPGIEPRSLDLQTNTHHIFVKASFYHKAVEVCYIIPKPCDIHPNSSTNFLVQESCGHESNRDVYAQNGHRVGYLR